MLTEKQKRFCNEYLVDFNATQAAIRSGYSAKTAYSIGSENLRKPEIKEYLKQEAQERILGEDATKKLLSDIATACINDYMVIRKVSRCPLVEKPLKQIIKEAEAEIAFEDEFASKITMDEKRLQRHLEEQERRKERVIRLKLELKHDPKAKRIVEGKAVLEEVAELDLVKLAADKERGRIKSISHGQFGPKVELHDSGAALTNLARIHGLFAPEKSEVDITVTWQEEKTYEAQQKADGGA